MPVPVEELREVNRQERMRRGWRALDPLPVVESYNEEPEEVRPVVTGTAQEIREDSNGYVWVRTPEDPEWRREPIDVLGHPIRNRIGFIDGAPPVLPHMNDRVEESRPEETIADRRERNLWRGYSVPDYGRRINQISRGEVRQIEEDPENQPNQFTNRFSRMWDASLPIGHPISSDSGTSNDNRSRDWIYASFHDGKMIVVDFDTENNKKIIDAEVMQEIEWEMYKGDQIKEGKMWGFL